MSSNCQSITAGRLVKEATLKCQVIVKEIQKVGR